MKRRYCSPLSHAPFQLAFASKVPTLRSTCKFDIMWARVKRGMNETKKACSNLRFSFIPYEREIKMNTGDVVSTDFIFGHWVVCNGHKMLTKCADI